MKDTKGGASIAKFVASSACLAEEAVRMAKSGYAFAVMADGVATTSGTRRSGGQGGMLRYEHRA